MESAAVESGVKFKSTWHRVESGLGGLAATVQRMQIWEARMRREKRACRGLYIDWSFLELADAAREERRARRAAR